MKVTREVIIDLWPVYESGEASAVTRQLVEEYLEGDPELAASLREEPAAQALGMAYPLTRDPELETLLRARERFGRPAMQRSIAPIVAVYLALAFVGAAVWRLALGRPIELWLAWFQIAMIPPLAVVLLWQIRLWRRGRDLPDWWRANEHKGRVPAMLFGWLAVATALVVWVPEVRASGWWIQWIVLSAALLLNAGAYLMRVRL